MFGQMGHIGITDFDSSFIHREHAGHHIHQRRFTCTVAADDSHKVAVSQIQVYTVQSYLLIDRTSKEGLTHISDFKHCEHHPS